MPLFVRSVDYEILVNDSTPLGSTAKGYSVRAEPLIVKVVLEGTLDVTEIQKLRILAMHEVNVVAAQNPSYGPFGSPKAFMKNEPKQRIVHGLRQKATRRVSE